MVIQNKNESSMPLALITGASGGLGRQIALTLSENNYNIVINYFRSEEKASTVLQAMHQNSLAVKADIKDIKQVEDMATQVEDKYGRLDVIINNAGITKDNLLLKQTEQEWDETINTNLKGCFNIIKTMAPIMIKSKGGHIINISSYSGIKGKAGQAAYSTSKAGLLGLTFSAAQELAVHNIRVNALMPGYMMTEMGKKAAKAMEMAKKSSIINKLSNPEDVSKFIISLINTENITGQIFSIDSRIL